MPQAFTKEEFLKLMRFPQEWLAWGMYPDQLFEIQVAGYEPGNERGSEHDRYGAVHWWIHQDPSADELIKLFRLMLLDPDQVMAEDARKHLRSCRNYNPILEQK